MNKPTFNWGDSSPKFIDLITKEIFEENCYETIYPVKNGDVVLDLGASIGPFTWSIMDKASKVIAVEPSTEIAPLIEQNTVGYPVTIVSKGLVKYETLELDAGNVYHDIDDFGVGDKNKVGKKDSNVTTFSQIIKENNLDRIDFIKTDCEGGEYALFTDQNMPFLLNNVRDIVGEFHLRSPEHKVEFRYFRDRFLKQFPKYEIYSVDGVNLGWTLWEDHLINRYKEVIIHISNDA